MSDLFGITVQRANLNCWNGMASVKADNNDGARVVLALFGGAVAHRLRTELAACLPRFQTFRYPPYPESSIAEHVGSLSQGSRTFHSGF
jgi:hypothetical protein